MTHPPDIARTTGRRAVTILSLACFALVLLAGRLVQLQIVLAPTLLDDVRRQQVGESPLRASRGRILDARGRVLAVSRQMPDVFVDPKLVKDVGAVAAELAARLNLDPLEIKARIERRRDRRYVVIAREVDEVEAEAIRALRNRAVGLTDRAVRSYPLESSMGQVLGFVGRDGSGLEGIELGFDAHLSVRDGKRSTIRDARRRALWRTIGGSAPPRDGGHVVLTIDAEIQRIAESAIADVVEEFHAESAVAVVMEPKTGAIRAMACVPLFDPSLAGTTPPDIRRNRTVTDPVEPGSTFKPFILSGALAGGHVDTRETFDCSMGMRRFGRRVLRDSRPHGDLTPAEIVIKSSNIGMGLIGERMGAEALHRTLKAFGFGTTTGIEFPGESAGLVYPLRKWSKLSVTSIPMGYEVLVTPLQLATALCTIVNDGVMIRPRLIQGLLAADGSPLSAPSLPEVVGRVLPEAVSRYMRDKVLLPTVEEGTGWRARVVGYQVLGKTGTAKLVDPETHLYEPGLYLGSFIAAAPASDPRLVVLVMVRRPDPSQAYYGGRVAAPAVRVILTEALAYLAVTPDKEGFASAR